jgi:hypothetical protein
MVSRLSSEIIKNGGFLSNHTNHGLCFRIIVKETDEHDFDLESSTDPILPLLLVWIMSYWDQEKVSIYHWDNPFKLDDEGFGVIKLICISPNKTKTKSETLLSIDFTQYQLLIKPLLQFPINLINIRQICSEYNSDYFTKIENVMSTMHINRTMFLNNDHDDDGIGDVDEYITRYIYYGVNIQFSKNV